MSYVDVQCAVILIFKVIWSEFFLLMTKNAQPVSS